jgi:hypothetical protein
VNKGDAVCRNCGELWESPDRGVLLLARSLEESGNDLMGPWTHDPPCASESRQPWRWELEPLTFGRARIILTDGMTVEAIYEYQDAESARAYFYKEPWDEWDPFANPPVEPQGWIRITRRQAPWVEQPARPQVLGKSYACVGWPESFAPGRDPPFEQKRGACGWAGVVQGGSDAKVPPCRRCGGRLDLWPYGEPVFH